MTALKESLVRHPYNRDTLLGLVSFSRDTGDVGRALEYAEQLARIAPADPNVSDLIEDHRQKVR
jgi:hypothetical protein